MGYNDGTLGVFVIPVREYIGDIEYTADGEISDDPSDFQFPEVQICRWSAMMIARKEKRYPENIGVEDPIWKCNAESALTVSTVPDRYLELIGSLVKAFRLPNSNRNIKLPDQTTDSESLFKMNPAELIRMLITDYILEIQSQKPIGQIVDLQGMGQNQNATWVAYLKQRDKSFQGFGLGV